ncbi:MAG: hypothetical protein AB1726_10040, partial [Planctomycetota bacterium]
RAVAAAGLAAIAAEPALARVGRPAPEHVEYARALVDALPAAVREAAREPYGARALVYGLLLDPADDGVRRAQLAHLAAGPDAAVHAATNALAPALAAVDPSARLPLVDLALPALRELSPAQYAAFRANVEALIRADRRLDLFEWVLGRILLRHLEPGFDPSVTRPVGSAPLPRFAGPCAVLLGALARAGSGDPAAARAAFARGAERLGLALPLALPAATDLRALEGALAALATVAPSGKRAILAAGAAAISADGGVSVAEGELFRAVADSLGCPVPPLLPGQPLHGAPDMPK